MRRAAFLALGLVLMAAAPASMTTVHLIATDRHQSPLAGFRFAYNGVRSSATTPEGAATLEIPPGLRTGDPIALDLILLGKKEKDWFLPDPNINIPGPATAAKLVLMRLAEFRSTAREVTKDLYPSLGELRLALVEAMKADGLSEPQLDGALRLLAESEVLADRRLAAYLNGQPSKLERLLPKKSEDPDEYATALRDLGASQYQAGSYQEAATSFRRAAQIHSADPALQRMLASTLFALADWAGAEKALQQAVALDGILKSPSLFWDPNMLAQVDPETRITLWVRQAMAVGGRPSFDLLAFEDRSGGSLIDLAEAEPLRRQALAQDEASLGPNHPKVLRDLKALAESLEAKGDATQAESLMRRALRSDEKILGPYHPTVASDLTHLARLLEKTRRPEEAERLLYRASSILLAFGERAGHAHPDLTSTLVRYAQLRKRLSRSPTALHAMVERLPPPGAHVQERFLGTSGLAAVLPPRSWKWALLFGVAGLTLSLIAFGVQGRRRQAAIASGRTLLLVARDPLKNAVAGIRFLHLPSLAAYGDPLQSAGSGIRLRNHPWRTRPTNRQGETTLDLWPGEGPDQSIQIAVAGPAWKKWFLIGGAIRIPDPGFPVEVVVMRKSAFREFYQEARDAGAISRDGMGDREGILLEVAGRYGLKLDQVEEAIASFFKAEGS